MKAFTLIESQSQNRYFYDQEAAGTHWCHPLLHYILKMVDRGIDVNTWFKELSDDDLRIEGYGIISKREITYYYRKYLLLKENGFFGSIDTQQYLSRRLSGDDIKSSLANIRHVTFEVTDACNLECAYCTYGRFYDNYDRREKKKLSTTVAKTFLDFLMKQLNSPLNRSHDQPLYIGFYGGEPLLNFSFIEEIVDFIEGLKPEHNRFLLSMTTNGLLLEKHMDFLAAHDILLLISLDGNETNNSYRVFPDGTPAYPGILKNIEALRRAHPDYFESRVNFNAVFHNRNSVTDIFHYFKSRFDKIPTISELNPSGIRDAMREGFFKTYANVNADLHRLEDYSLVEKEMFIRLPNIMGVSRFLDQCSGFVFSDYNDLLAVETTDETGSCPPRTPRLPTGTCMPFSRKAFITVNGKILPCEQIGHQYGLGRVDKTGVQLNFTEIAETYNRYFDKLKDQCRVCANAEGCLQCIFYLEPEKRHPRCSGKLNREEFSQFLSTQISYLEKNPLKYKKIMTEVRIE